MGREGWDFMSGVCDYKMGSMLKLAKRFNCFYINNRRVFYKIITKFMSINIKKSIIVV